MKSHPFKFLHLNVRRSPCFECSGPAHPLGEAHRLDLAEGGFTVIRSCLRCVSRRTAEQRRGACGVRLTDDHIERGKAA